MMNILFAVSEASPFVKTGGLGDVAGSLPAVLAARGNDVRVILPLYERIAQQWRDRMTFQQCFYLKLAWRSAYCGVFTLRKDGVEYWFIDNEYYFKRAEPYGHYDDGERFAFFSRAVIEAPARMQWSPDIIHCNDWQTALVPVYLLEERDRTPALRGAKSVFTIHNIEYQGRYGDHTMEDLFGLSRSYFNEQMLAYHGDVNLMKGAIYACDFLTTVSPTYAQELQYSFYAHGLEGVVWDNRYKLRGILNGIDMERYNPAADPALAQRFSPAAPEGKGACKEALQRAAGLKDDPDVPVIACISRLVRHKGFDLITAALHEIMDMNVQLVVLGTGDWNYEAALRHAAGQYPSRMAAHILYSDSMSSVIYAGADLFLMPSVSEPCGLAQMIAMRYGTVPVVRETGGLRDTVTPYNEYTGGGRGFTFSNISSADMVDAVRRAVRLFETDKKTWSALQRAGMTADLGWGSAADQYMEIYRSLTGIFDSVSPEEGPEEASEEPLAGEPEQASDKHPDEGTEEAADPAPKRERKPRLAATGLSPKKEPKARPAAKGKEKA